MRAREDKRALQGAFEISLLCDWLMLRQQLTKLQLQGAFYSSLFCDWLISLLNDQKRVRLSLVKPTS